MLESRPVRSALPADADAAEAPDSETNADSLSPSVAAKTHSQITPRRDAAAEGLTRVGRAFDRMIREFVEPKQREKNNFKPCSKYDRSGNADHVQHAAPRSDARLDEVISV